MKKILKPALILGLAAFAAMLCRGDVFMRLGGSGWNRSAQGLGASEVYRAQLRINGGGGELTVLGWDSDFASVIARLSRAYGLSPSRFAVGDGMALGVVRNSSHVVKLLWVDAAPRCVLFRLEQTDDQDVQSGKPPARHMLDSVPAFPASTPAFYMENADTGTGFEMSRAVSDPAAIQAFYGSTLKSDGWTSPFTTRFAGPVPLPVRVYVKGKEILLISVMSSGRAEGSIISLLRK